MGEPLLAAYLQTLLDKLDSGPLLNFARQAGFRSELRTWRSKLLQVRRVLCDAEEKQVSDREVKKWLDNLRDLAYSADDVLDELRYEALQRQNNSSSGSATSSSQVQDLLAQIREITTRFLDIEEDKNDLGLKERPGVRSSIIANRLPTTSLVDSSQIVGREKDVDAILKLLDIGETTKAEEKQSRVFGMGGFQSSSVSKHGKPERSSYLEAPCSETRVIPIVGMGGVGKTTLAQCIYNHCTLKNSFKLKAWVCVSDNFDITGVTKAILCQVADKDAADVDDLNLLQVRLKEKISWQRFLIVLDDIWNEDYGEWENLFIPFKSGRPGSVVIVTSRSSKVASITGSTSHYNLNILKDDECLSILAQHALRAENFDTHPNLKVIGEKMVRRCEGLPLAAKTLGGLLRYQDQARWEEVCSSSLWSGSISEKIAPALWLSFNYLPSHLKWCFVYCSIFSKDYEFHEEELILLWMAEGFLGEPNEEKQMEDLGHEYFHDLLSRSLLQQSSHYSRKFVIHDLIHDLARMVAGKVCFCMEDNKVEYVDAQAVCHLSYPLYGLEPNKFEVLKNTKRLRTLLPLPTQKRDYAHFMNEKLLHDLLPHLRYLRVLSLSHSRIHELPSSIGDLKHLRYLNLSYTHIKLLPESLCGLHSVQSLILKGCYLQRLPLRLIDLANLRYLDISHMDGLRGVPPHVLDLNFFQKLTKFMVGELRSFGGPRKVHHLPGGLQISILDKVEDVEDALVINLMNKKNIEELKFRWWGGENLDNTENAESQVQILNLLEPRKMLRNLVIEGYCGVTLPNWIGDSLYSKMVELSLINCERCKSLPSLGQLPLLQKLTIEGMLEMETIGTELYGEASLHGQPFPSLKTLKFYKMPKWVNWSLPVGITSLLHLKIIDCPQLVVPVLATFPSLQHLTVAGVENISSGVHCLTSLTELSIRGCENLQTLPDGIISSNSNLQVLEIRDCTSLESFPSGVLPSTLERLSIRGCENLQTLPDGIISSNSNLQVLKIRDCTSLESFPSGVLPSTLKRLSIRSCRKLESISEMLLVPTSIDRIEFFEYPNLKSLPECLCTNISYLCIEKCESIESFPETGLPSPNITCLEIRSCENLKYLPGNLPKLTSLTELCVVECDNLVSLPEGGLPPSLQNLVFVACAKVEKQMWDEWAPHKLPSLRSLRIKGGFRDVVSFPYPAQESQSLLPPTLISLFIGGFQNLESLSSSAFRNLTSLADLEICDCPKLQSLPIEALPPSLLGLLIWGCPELTPKCKKGGEYWLRLSHISPKFLVIE